MFYNSCFLHTLYNIDVCEREKKNYFLEKCFLAIALLPVNVNASSSACYFLCPERTQLQVTVRDASLASQLSRPEITISLIRPLLKLSKSKPCFLQQELRCAA